MSLYHGRRTRRPALRALGFAALAVSVVPAVLFLEAWFVIGGCVAFFAAMFLSMMPRPATVEVAGDQLRFSWGATVPVGTVRVGRWVMPVVDAPVGLALHVGGIRIGGVDHVGDGRTIDARPTRAVDFELAEADFDALAAELHVPRTASGELVVDLVRNSQGARGMFATMAPWLLTIVVVSAIGITLAATGLGDRIMRMRYGVIAMGLGTGAIVVAGLVWTIVRSMRPRLPGLELRASAAGVALVRDGAEVTRVPWGALRLERSRHEVHFRGTSLVYPVLSIHLGDHPLVIGCWDSREAWPDAPPRTGSPPWIAGRPQWRRLIELSGRSARG